MSVLPCPLPRAPQPSSGSRKLLEKGRPGGTGLEVVGLEGRKGCAVQGLPLAGEGQAQHAVYIFPPFLLVALLAGGYTTAVCWPQGVPPLHNP